MSNMASCIGEFSILCTKNADSPATFQAMMNHLFHDLIMEGKVIIYLDSILIFSKDINEHCKITQRVLQILRENKLSLKPEKCEFEITETKYLGMIIGNGQICMDPTKVQAICKGVIERTYPLSSPSTLDLVLLQNSKILVLDDGKG
jgi:hypothetical protein